MLTINVLLLILAFVAFCLAAFGATIPRVNLVALGLALWMFNLLI